MGRLSMLGAPFDLLISQSNLFTIPPLPGCARLAGAGSKQAALVTVGRLPIVHRELGAAS